MVTEKDVREAWVTWQIAEAKQKGWSHAECLDLREDYCRVRDQFRLQEGEITQSRFL